MRLNHLDLPVRDIAATRDFFETWLGFTHLETRGAAGLAILRDPSGLVLVLSRLQRDGVQSFPTGFHIGFHLETEAAVGALHARLSHAGLGEIAAPSMQRGAFSFYFHGPDQLLIEVACRPSPA
jgi:catechol 2,3-dioxygenase-like lactoylglutathione lyase family enzyme